MNIRENLVGQSIVVGTMLLASWATALSAQTGYRIERDTNQVIVDTRSHWEHWAFATGTIEITPDGGVKPRRQRKDTNAVLDILDFLRFNPPEYLSKKEPRDIVLLDAIAAGSNRAGVVRALDGDLNTYWEPNPVAEDTRIPLQWWFTVDLGKLVMVRKVVLKFVPEEQGDPFLLFDVLFSDGQKPIKAAGGTSLEFWPILQALKPNKSQRLFEVELNPTGVDQRRGLARFVQVVVQGSDLGLGLEVSATDYNLLDPADRGLIEYSKVQADGREIPVKQVVYEAIDPARQGSIRYYRREQPRLAELEVWGDGDDLLSHTLIRGGSIQAESKHSPNRSLDGDVSSSIGLKVFDKQKSRSGQLLVDLGSLFWIDSYGMLLHFPHPVASTTFGDFQVDLSEGTPGANGDLKWHTAARHKGTAILVSGGLQVQGFDFAPVRARFFRLRYDVVQNHRDDRLAHVSEIQLFGGGFLPEATLESDLIRLGGSRNLVSIAWDADTPPGTQVRIQTRTGDTLNEVLHYYRNDGKEVSREAYEKLLSIFKGDIESKEVGGSDWEPWSGPYVNPTGSPVTSPSPRAFLKLRATLSSDNPEIAPTLTRIRLHFAEPVAQRLLGEVSPNQVDQLGQAEEFSVYMRPQFGPGDRGFDQLLLKVPAGMVLDFVGLFGGLNEGLLKPLPGEIVAASADSVLLSFAPLEPGSEVAVLRVDFKGTLFSRGGSVELAVRRGADSAAVWQRVDPGDVVAAVASNRLLVVGQPQRRSIFADLEVPSIITPNGDGINDQAMLRFSVILVEGRQQVEATIYDLQGHALWRSFEERAVSTGTYAMMWDGRDAAGTLVPPGLYVVRLKLDANTSGAALREEAIIRTLAVAY